MITSVSEQTPPRATRQTFMDVYLHNWSTREPPRPADLFIPHSRRSEACISTCVNQALSVAGNITSGALRKASIRCNDWDLAGQSERLLTLTFTQKSWFSDEFTFSKFQITVTDSCGVSIADIYLYTLLSEIQLLTVFILLTKAKIRF